MKLKPLGNSFIFKFLNETAGGRFIERNSGKIILTNQDWDNMGKLARWGRIEAVGNRVRDLKVGDLVLIEALQWTKEMQFEGEGYWKSDESKVIAVSDDLSDTYSY